MPSAFAHQKWPQGTNSYGLNKKPGWLYLSSSYRRCAIVTMAQRKVAIDWSNVGIGVVGEDLVSLLIGSTLFFDSAASDLPTLDRLAFRQDVTGLQENGWPGSPQVIRLGYTVAACLRLGVGVLQFLPFWLDESKRAFLDQTFRQPLEVIADQHALIGRFLLGLAEEARQLLRDLNQDEAKLT